MSALRHVIVLILMLAASGLILTSLMSAETPVGSVEGTLKTADRGTTLAHVEVTLARTDGANKVYEAETNAAGRFSFSRVEVGAYTLTTHTEAHQQPKLRITVDEGQTVKLLVELLPTAPFLHIFQHQRVFTTKEAPAMNCRGFIAGNMLAVTVYRLSQKIAVRAWHGSLSDILAQRGNLASVDLDARKDMTKVSTFNLPITNKARDAEGVFKKQIKFAQFTPAFYLVVLQAANVREFAGLAITDLEMVVKASPKQVLAYAVDIDSGKPVADVAVTVKQEDKTVTDGQTGDNGLALLPLTSRLEEGELTVIGQRGDSLAISEIYLYGLGRNNGKTLSVYTYTDRPVYRPGQVVYFKSLMRELHGDNYTVPASLTATVHVVDQKDDVIYNAQLATNDYGSLNGQFTLDPSALPGSYTMTVTTPAGPHEATFSVAEYRKPEFDVTVTPVKKRYNQGETINATVSAQYYFGAPVSNAKVDYYVTRTNYWYGEDSYNNWDADLEGNEARGGRDYGEGEFVDHGKGVTNAGGRLVVTIPPKKAKTPAKAESDYAEDWAYTIHATVTDESQHPEDGSGEVLVTQGDYRIRAELDNWVVKPKQPVQVSITLTDYDGKPIAGADGAAELVHTTWAGGQEHRQPVAQAAWHTDAHGLASVAVTPTEDGSFDIRLSTVDRHGNRITHNLNLWVMNAEYASFDYPYQDIDVKADKKLYHEGDTARIIVNTRHAPVTALLTVESGSLMEQRLVHLAQKSTILTLPVKPEYMPSVQVGVCFIKGKSFFSGNAIINESREKKALTLKITTDKKVYQPGEKATYRVTVLTPDGKPAQAEVSLGLVDEALYAIAPDDTENIVSFFYPKRENVVRTGFSFPEIYLSGDDKAGSTIRTRRVFRDTAFWNPAAVTDSAGTATFDLTMPDNLTTWRATCRAATLDTRVGQATYKTVVQKPFLLRLEAPRFFTQGDEVTVAAIAHNLTANPIDAQIGIDSGGGFILTGRQTRKESIVAGGAVRVEWTVKTPFVGNIPLRVWGKAGDLSDAMELTLPVQPKGRRKLDLHSGHVTDTANLAFTVRQDVVPGTQQFSLRLSPSLTASMLGSLDYLASYPYGCAEQTMSSFLPDVVIAQMLSRLGIDNPGLRARLPDMVHSGLLKLYGFQHDDGGWHWWRYDDQTDAWMTAYVIYGLLQARDAGFDVNPQVLKQGIEALTKLAEDPKQGSPDTRAYLAYVLALTGNTDAAGKVVAEFDAPDNLKRGKLTDWGQVMLARALRLGGREDEGRKIVETQLAKFAREGIPSQNAYSGEGDEWRANTEYAGVLISAAAEMTPTDNRLGDLVQWVMEQRQDNHWESTRDTAFVLYGLSRYLQQTKELQPDMDVTVTAGARKITRHFGREDLFKPEYVITIPSNDLPPGNFAVAITKSGQGRLYYTARLSQMANEDLTVQVDDGSDLQITRHYRKIQQGRPLSAGKQETTFDNADIVEVTLTVRAQKHHDYLMVEDPLPAGFEPEDRGVVDPYEWTNWWSEQIARDNRISFALRQLDPGERKIIYRCNARTPGIFTALPPVIYDMYNPMTRADGVADMIKVKGEG